MLMDQDLLQQCSQQTQAHIGHCFNQLTILQTQMEQKDEFINMFCRQLIQYLFQQT